MATNIRRARQRRIPGMRSSAPQGHPPSARSGHATGLLLVAVLLLSGACSDDLGPLLPGEDETPGIVRWSFDGSAWRASGPPPACPSPLTVQPPVDFNRATSILYPGQERGGNYKAHGGARFDAAGQTNDVLVFAPMAGDIFRAARYLVDGEIQYTFDIINSCGILHRLGHLRALAPRMQAIADRLPAATEGDSRSTPLPAGIAVTRGEMIATAVGFRNTGNVFFDWGVYDLRQRNLASTRPDWPASRSLELDAHAICWFDLLPPADAERVRSLPPADGVSGAQSDFCR